MREPELCVVDVEGGRLGNASGRYTKSLRELDGLYADALAWRALMEQLGDNPVYEVTDFRPSAASGDLIFGVTKMQPGKVGREFFLTRGHLHAQADRPEIYYGESGRGVMLLESPAGEVRALEIAPRTICYVPPYWIHRSVNVGPDVLVMTFAYPADSGQDYEIIARSGGMRSRVVDDGAGNWALEDNEGYRGRSVDEVARIFGSDAAAQLSRVSLV